MILEARPPHSHSTSSWKRDGGGGGVLCVTMLQSVSTSLICLLTKASGVKMCSGGGDPCVDVSDRRGWGGGGGGVGGWE